MAADIFGGHFLGLLLLLVVGSAMLSVVEVQPTAQYNQGIALKMKCINR